MMYYTLSNTISDLRCTLLVLPIWLLSTGSVTYGQTPVYDMDLKIDPEAHQFINDFIDRNVKTNEALFDLIRETLGTEALAKMKELRERI
jgi:hypothetical protein